MSQRAALLLLACWSALLLSIGLTREWRLVHEDNGAMQTSLALSHLREGIAATRAHNWFVPKNGDPWIPYPHHPAGVPLLVAAAFAASGTESPAVARSVMIAFSVGSVLLAYALIVTVLGDRAAAFAGALFFATVPMQSFFGRMVNYEPPTLFFTMLMLLGWTRYRITGSRWALRGAAAAIVAGLTIDWTIAFFSAAVAVAEGVSWIRSRSSLQALITVVLATAAGVALAFAHIAVAFGSLERFFGVLGRDVGAGHDPLRLADFLLLQVENYRHYFSASGLVISAIVAAAALAPRSGGVTATRAALRPLLLVTGGAALAYVLVSPNRARLHHYWQFYFLPFAALAFALAFLWLRRRRATTLAVVIALEIAAATGYKLYRRHTEPGEYAVGEIRETERLFHAPR